MHNQSLYLVNEALVESGVGALLNLLEGEKLREGLKDTPKRWVKAMREMTRGYLMDPGEILKRTFEASYDQMVVLTNISFTSLCEHHLLPFTGTVDLGYIPRGKRVVGLSKLARLVDCYACRLQMQERMTQQIAEAVWEHLKPEGAGVVVRAHHSCMSCRGVMKAGAVMKTSSMQGSFRDEAETRAEFLELCREGK